MTPDLLDVHISTIEGLLRALRRLFLPASQKDMRPLRCPWEHCHVTVRAHQLLAHRRLVHGVEGEQRCERDRSNGEPCSFTYMTPQAYERHLAAWHA